MGTNLFMEKDQLYYVIYPEKAWESSIYSNPKDALEEAMAEGVQPEELVIYEVRVERIIKPKIIFE